MSIGYRSVGEGGECLVWTGVFAWDRRVPKGDDVVIVFEHAVNVVAGLVGSVIEQVEYKRPDHNEWGGRWGGLGHPGRLVRVIEARDASAELLAFATRLAAFAVGLAHREFTEGEHKTIGLLLASAHAGSEVEQEEARRILDRAIRTAGANRHRRKALVVVRRAAGEPGQALAEAVREAQVHYRHLGIMMGYPLHEVKDGELRCWDAAFAQWEEKWVSGCE